MDIDLDDWKKLPTQSRVYNDNFTNIIMQSSGLGGGKSHGLVRKTFQLSALNQGFSGGFLCPSYKDFKRDIRPLFQQELDETLGLKEGKHYWFHKSDFEYRFIWNKKPLYIFSGEKPIAGPNLAYCLINEFSLIPYERINEMLRRVRVAGAPVLQKIMAGTPEDVYGWLEDFVEQQTKLNNQIEDNFKLYTSDTDENVYIDKNYGMHLEGMLDPVQLKIFKSGQIGATGGDKFYYAFDSVKNRTDKTLDLDENIYVNIDFNVGNMHATISQQEVFGETKISYFVDEIILKENGADTYAMRDEIVKRFHRQKSRIIITIDASGRNRKTTGQSDAKVLRTVFTNVRYKASGNERLKKRQILINGLFYNKYLFINKEKCPTLWKDVTRVKQKEDFTKDDKGGALGHACDTMDYYCTHEYNLKSKESFNDYKAM